VFIETPVILISNEELSIISTRETQIGFGVMRQSLLNESNQYLLLIQRVFLDFCNKMNKIIILLINYFIMKHNFFVLLFMSRIEW